MSYCAPMAAALMSIAATGALAAGPEHWQATSTTAISITGNVTFTPEKISFATNKSLSLGEGTKISTFIGNGKKVDATVYKVTAPTDLQLVRGNRLCDGRAVTYIVVWNSPKIGSDVAPRSMSPFSGPAMPTSDSGPASCGTFNYDAGGK